MILEVQHETRLTYTEAVTESIAEVRMEPVSDADQSCRSFHLAVHPATGPQRYIDGFGALTLVVGNPTAPMMRFCTFWLMVTERQL